MDETARWQEAQPPSEQELMVLHLLRRRRLVLAVPLLGLLPVMWLASRLGLDSAYGFVAWMLLAMVCIVPSSVARCPRCGLRFHFSLAEGLPASSRT